MIVIVACGITGDRRREDDAMLLSGYGPRVQLSVSGAKYALPTSCDARAPPLASASAGGGALAWSAIPACGLPLQWK
jgi:hypothetical protein